MAIDEKLKLPRYTFAPFYWSDTNRFCSTKSLGISYNANAQLTAFLPDFPASYAVQITYNVF